jgi:molybdopterin synthase catalytic subunit
MITARITEELISADALAASVKSETAGAVVTFAGDVRNHDKGKSVSTFKLRSASKRTNGESKK